MPEIWLPVVGYEGMYEVSSYGRVQSLSRFKSNGVWQEGRILRPGPQRRGYLTVSLCDAKGAIRSFKVHLLVLEAFVGAKPKGLMVCHRNDIPGDNALVNLYYGTAAQNLRDATKNGRWGLTDAPRCACGHEFVIEPVYRDPNNGLRACADCRASWRERHPIYA